MFNIQNKGKSYKISLFVLVIIILSFLLISISKINEHNRQAQTSKIQYQAEHQEIILLKSYIESGEICRDLNLNTNNLKDAQTVKVKNLFFITSDKKKVKDGVHYIKMTPKNYHLIKYLPYYLELFIFDKTSESKCVGYLRKVFNQQEISKFSK